MTGIELIAQERAEQINKHGYTLENDQKYKHGELPDLVLYMMMYHPKGDADQDELGETLIDDFGFTQEFLDKLNNKPDIEKLVVMGALIAAEIDRLQNK